MLLEGGRWRCHLHWIRHASHALCRCNVHQGLLGLPPCFAFSCLVTQHVLQGSFHQPAHHQATCGPCKSILSCVLNRIFSGCSSPSPLGGVVGRGLFLRFYIWHFHCKCISWLHIGGNNNSQWVNERQRTPDLYRQKIKHNICHFCSTDKGWFWLHTKVRKSQNCPT